MYGQMPRSRHTQNTSPFQFDQREITQNYPSTGLPRQEPTEGFFDNIYVKPAQQQTNENWYALANQNNQAQYMSAPHNQLFPQVNADALLSVHPTMKATPKQQPIQYPSQVNADALLSVHPTMKATPKQSHNQQLPQVNADALLSVHPTMKATPKKQPIQYQVNADALLSVHPAIKESPKQPTAFYKLKTQAQSVEDSNMENNLFSPSPCAIENRPSLTNANQTSKSKAHINIFASDTTPTNQTPEAYALLSNNLNQTYPSNEASERQSRNFDLGYYRSRTQNEIQEPSFYNMEKGLKRMNSFNKKSEPETNNDECMSLKSDRRLSIFERSPESRKSLRVVQNDSFYGLNSMPNKTENGFNNLLSQHPSESSNPPSQEEPLSSLRKIGNLFGFKSNNNGSTSKNDMNVQSDALTELNAKLNSKEAEICDLKFKISNISELNKTLEDRIAALERENTRAKASMEMLKGNEISLQVQLDNSKRSSSCVEHHFKISQLESENAELKLKYQSLKISATGQQVNPENDTTNERILKLEAFIKELKRKNELLEAQINS